MIVLLVKMSCRSRDSEKERNTERDLEVQREYETERQGGRGRVGEETPCRSHSGRFILLSFSYKKNCRTNVFY